MNKDCFIAEDLLPLYNDGLLQEETDEWLESHLKSCQKCNELAQLTKEPVEKETIISPVNHDKMMEKIKLKLSIYQIIFVGISFFFAIKTSLLNESFGFILSYTVLGVITYLFYRNFLIVTAIAFLPIFLWDIFQSFSMYVDGDTSLLLGIIGSAFLALIHLIFALMGSVIGLLILKLKKRG
ncbi:zf-HC2 domain-containing protein [Lederbergia lenta]|uniref:YlaD protein n=1 Tax=Lederbergia lenta TaxID=1467 RepID=A0A2X4ZFE5_LEDLE|nr:zf-HC2 domain-containing protein [Lederbergia lenta]MCM3112225.1 zf-HC2 domain-containing protein [Lederbergia lenta]MEC2323393.1 zf-HC2 domain-containing protein [Lederbergia lenta]SQI63345.1 YlaD protein [Lederbergia lenta]